MSKTDEGNVEIKKIQDNIETQKRLVDRAIRQLETVERLKMPDSTPYFSFKTAESIEDLKGRGLGLRAALRNDIMRGQVRIKQLAAEARRIRQGDYELVVKRQHEALLEADRAADRRAMAIIEKAANTRGYLTEEEFAEVQGGLLKGLKGHVDFLRNHPSRGNIKETLDKLGRVYSMGMEDAETADLAMKTVQKASRRLVDDAKTKFLKKPTPAAASELMGEIANNEMLGGESAVAYIDQHIVPKLTKLALDAERAFRNNPTTDNCEAMFNAEYACVEAGGAPLADPPKGLRRIKAGTSRRFGPKDMLSAVSKEYYGSWSYWDVLVRYNWGVFRDPERPQTETVITVPY